MNPINVGIVGCGHWGPNHLRVFSQLPNCRVTACVDQDRARLEAVCAHYPNVEMFTEYDSFLKQADAEAVVIATPARTHFPLVRSAMEAGKHVLCEKPLCTESAQVDELAALAERNSLILMVGHVFLFNPGIVKLKELVHLRDAGRLYYLRSLRTNLGPIREDVNSVFDLATQDISIFNFLPDGIPESVSAHGAAYLRPGIEDVAFLTLRYRDGVMANIQVSWLDPKKLREIVVVGDKKMIVWDELSSPGPILIYDKGVIREPYYDDYGQFHLVAQEGDISVARVHLEEPLQVQSRYFLDRVSEGRNRISDATFATGVVRVPEAAMESMQKGGTPISNPRGRKGRSEAHRAPTGLPRFHMV